MVIVKDHPTNGILRFDKRAVLSLSLEKMNMETRKYSMINANAKKMVFAANPF
jgi:hypothetical protein